MRLEVRPALVARGNSLMSEFWSVHSLHGLGAMLWAALRSPWYSWFRRPRVARGGWVTPRR